VDQAFLEFAAGGRPPLGLAKPRLTVGRAPANDLQLNDNTVSGQHAAIEWQPEGWTVRDLGSSNGTQVNGRRIDQPWSLNPGDSVRFGHTELVFRIAGTVLLPDSPAPATGYLDATEEWTARGSPARPDPARPDPARPDPARPDPAPPPPPRPVAARPPVAGAKPGNDPLGSRRDGGFGQVRGVARNVQQQTRDQTKVLTFRVERYDPSGNRLDPVGVEFRDYRSGGLNDGEEVEVIGSWKRGTLRAQKVTNLTTHAEVLGPSAAYKFAYRAFATIFIIIFACIFGGIILAIVLSG
jgi:FHA domain